MKVDFKPKKLCGSFFAPPSKSFAHRIIICSALSRGKSRILNISESEDILATLDCVSALGADIAESIGGIEISGTGEKLQKSAVFPCRESGSTLRFLFPIALSLCENPIFTGSPRLMERGIGIYEEILREKGIEITKTETAIYASGRLTAGDYRLSGDISSQYISGLLFALPLLDGDSSITVIPPFESRSYVDITLDIIGKFGIEIVKDGENRYLIKGNQNYLPRNISVEGDWSNSAPFFAMNSLGSDISVSGLIRDSLQGDRVVTDCLSALDSENPKLDLSDCPDLAPVLFAVAAAKNGAEFTGTRRLKIKESDRAEAMRTELLKFGIEAEISENCVKIAKGNLTAPTAPVFSHNDHRIVMAMSVLLTLTGGEIYGAEAISKSFPDFFEVLKSLGAEVTYDA